jgi:dihydrofolate reductase
MRRIRYQVATSLDGYIAGPSGEADWIVHDPQIDFEELFAQFDTLLMGRVTYEDMLKMGPAQGFWGKQVLVFSRTLRPEEHPDITVVGDRIAERLDALRSRPGKDIWLFGGGDLLRSLLQLGQVDSIEPAIIPVLVGGGRPFLLPPAAQTALKLTGHRIFPSGIVWLEYEVDRRASGSATTSS